MYVCYKILTNEAFLHSAPDCKYFMDILMHVHTQYILNIKKHVQLKAFQPYLKYHKIFFKKTR